MKNKALWIILSCLMVLSLVLVSCTTTEEEEEEEGPVVEEEEEEEEEEGGPIVSGDWWDEFGEPEYGGIITFAPARFNMQENMDPNTGTFKGYGGFMYFLEPLFYWDWTIGPEEWTFPGAWGPVEVNAGCLLESWEQADPYTIIFHVREGIQWQDIPPMNGREFTAEDIQYHFDRLLGTGSGFTERSASWSTRQAMWESCVATDKYTCEFTLNTATGLGIMQLMEQNACSYIEPPEVIEQYGHMEDWENAIGTGPWILTDYIASSSLTFEKNTSYWGYDERHPDNQLPYADKLKVVSIPDVATRLAALRSGKADLTDELSWEQADSLERTNPEMQQASLPYMTDGIGIRTDLAPFDNLLVRKALEMAIDRPLIAETHFGGTVDGIPCGAVTRMMKGYVFDYEEDWPQELKDEYSYNPERARELLTEAGYPNGFQSTILAASNTDLDCLQIVQQEFKDIGVEVDLNVMEPSAAMAIQRAGNWEMSWGRNTGSTAMPHALVEMYTTVYQFEPVAYSDPVYDQMAVDMKSTMDLDEAQRLCVEMDRYILENHWGIRLFTKNIYNVWQSWLKGYSGWSMLRSGSPGGWPWARFWIDHDLKESMGY